MAREMSSIELPASRVERRSLAELVSSSSLSFSSPRRYCEPPSAEIEPAAAAATRGKIKQQHQLYNCNLIQEKN